jgi:hypothetical protein
LALWRSGSPNLHTATENGKEDMTKAKARQRAKAKAAQKTEKRNANANANATRSGPEVRPGQFDPGSGSIKGPGASAKSTQFAGARRQTSRSK